MAADQGAWSKWLEHLVDWLLETRLQPSIRTVRVNAGPILLQNHANVDNSWEKDAVEVHLSSNTFFRWIQDEPSSGDQEPDLSPEQATHKLLQFCGNDYLGLSMHPAVRAAAANAATSCGMGIRGSALICGYSSVHRRLETYLAQLKKTEECLLCPTGFSANMAVFAALSANAPGYSGNKIAIFSDELNHASIIDGVRVAQKQNDSEVYIYKHNNMKHLENLLTTCTLERKVVVTDTVFSMDGDLAPLDELVQLKEKFHFLLVIDDAHGTLVFGENGGGVAETFDVEDKIDIYVGTLSKAFGCLGGFIATSRKWKCLIQSRGRSFIYSTALPIPVVAAATAAVLINREEKWRRETLWKRVKQFSELTGIEAHSPIIPVVIGNLKKALQASRELLKIGFHVLAIGPPVIPQNSSRLRITLCAAHTEEHIASLCEALAPWLNKSAFKDEETKVLARM